LGTLKILTVELKKYKTYITAEMRWIGKGILQKKDSDLYYSCHNQKHIFGTGFIFDIMIIINIVLDFLSVNEKIYCLRVINKFVNISIINAHALMEDKKEPIKEEFYKTLERTYNRRPKIISKSYKGL